MAVGAISSNSSALIYGTPSTKGNISEELQECREKTEQVANVVFTIICKNGEIEVDSSLFKGIWFFFNSARSATKDKGNIQLQEFSKQCVEDWIESVKEREKDEQKKPERLVELYQLCDYIGDEEGKKKHFHNIRIACRNHFENITACLSVELHPDLSFIGDWYAQNINQGAQHALDNTPPENIEVVFNSPCWSKEKQFEFLKWILKQDETGAFFKSLKQLAKKGDTASLNKLGLLYREGIYISHLHIKKNCKLAARLFLEAAKRGNAQAQYNLGSMCFHQRKDEEALKWLTESAAQGNAAAKSYIGYMHFNGFGVRQSYEEALKWHQAAAVQENPTALNNVGYTYLHGLGVEINYLIAYWYFARAADQGNASAHNNLGHMYLNGLGIQKNAQEALQWLEKGAKLGNATAQKNLSCMYAMGLGVKKNEKQALKWCRKAACQKNPEAQIDLGFRYLKGKGVKKNLRKAFLWFGKAAKEEDPFAQNVVGFFYLTGIGVKKNEKQAFNWFYRSSIKGNATAKNNLGCLYLEGIGVSQNYQKALELFHELAAEGNASGQCNLAYMHQEGLGVNKNICIAYNWYDAAARQGNSAARNNLGCIYMEGIGCRKNTFEAYHRLKDLALEGHPAALNNFGCLYLTFGKKSESLATGLSFIKKSASNGNREAYKNLEYLSANDREDKVNIVEIKKYFKTEEQLLRHSIYDDRFIIEKVYSKVLP